MRIGAAAMASWLVVAGVPADVRAEIPKVGVIASVGMRKTWGLGEYVIPYWPREAPLHPAGSLTVTVAVSPHLAIGVRVAAAKVTYADNHHDCYKLLSTDHAVALQYTDARFTLGAWLGPHRSRFGSVDAYSDCVDKSPYPTAWSRDFTSYGATATVDVFRRDPHHVAIVLDVQTGTGGGHLAGKIFPSEGFNYSALTLGIGYRY